MNHRTTTTAFLAAIAAALMFATATAQSPYTADYALPYTHLYRDGERIYKQVFEQSTNPEIVLVTNYYLMDEKRGWWQKLDTIKLAHADATAFVARQRHEIRKYQEYQRQLAIERQRAAEREAIARDQQEAMEKAMERAAENAIRRAKWRGW